MKILITVILVSIVTAQDIQLSGNIQFTHNVGDKTNLNSNTQGDNPFNRMRSKLFLFSEISDNIDIDIEIAFDDLAHADRWIWLHGASINIHHLFDSDLINFKIGKIPSNVGQFPNRANEAENNLIGLPLAYHYRTLVDWKQVWDGNSQIILRDKRDPTTAFISYDAFPTASPIAYEAVWDYGINLNGFHDFFEYSAMVSTGSLSNPKKNLQDFSDEYQYSGRIGFLPTDWLNFGFSGARSKYLSTSINLPQEKIREDFNQYIYAADLSIELQDVQIFAEYFLNRWHNVNIEKEYKVKTGFVELAYTMPFDTKWQLVGRYDFMTFNKILVDRFAPSENPSAWWDSDFTRIEFGIVYQLNRKFKIKSVFQQWDYEHYPTQAFTSIQLLVLF